MNVTIEQSWKPVLEHEFEQEYFRNLTDFVRKEYKQHTIYPAGKHIFGAFDQCSFDDVKVVILGQDPYHGPDQAHGLSFSVQEGIPMPPSLLNIFKEIQSDLGQQIPPNGSLVRWARQGVLLLNATLTVRAGQPGSHQKHGWEEFTDAVVRILSDRKEHLVFLLWGAYAQKKGAMIDRSKHLVLESPHPSPFSAHKGFLGNRHFSKTNEYLISKGLQPIRW